MFNLTDISNHVQGNIPVKEVARSLSRPIVDVKVAIDKELCSPRHGQTQLERAGGGNRQLPGQLDCPRRSESWREEVVQLDPRVLKYKGCDCIRQRVQRSRLVVIERAEPAGLSRWRLEQVL